MQRVCYNALPQSMQASGILRAPLRESAQVVLVLLYPPCGGKNQLWMDCPEPPERLAYVAEEQSCSHARILIPTLPLCRDGRRFPGARFAVSRI